MLKTIFCLLNLLLVSSGLLGQDYKTKSTTWPVRKFYGGLGAVISAPGVFVQGSASIVFNKGLGLSLDGTVAAIKAQNLPSGYKSGLCLFGNCTPKDDVFIFSSRALKAFNSPDKLTAYILEAGPSVTIYNQTYFKASPPSWFGSNYDEYRLSKTGIGLATKVKVIFSPHKNIGIGLGIYSNVNRVKMINGLELNLVFGRFY